MHKASLIQCLEHLFSQVDKNKGNVIAYSRIFNQIVVQEKHKATHLRKIGVLLRGNR